MTNLYDVTPEFKKQQKEFRKELKVIEKEMLDKYPVKLSKSASKGKRIKEVTRQSELLGVKFEVALQKRYNKNK